MALEDEVVKGPQAQEQPQQEQDAGVLNAEEEKDLAIAVMMAENLIDDGGIEVIDASEESSNPGEVIGQFIMQMVSQMAEQMPRELQFSPRIWLAEGGFVEKISDYLQEQYGVPQPVMDKAEMFVAAQADSMAKGAVQQQTAPAQPQAAPMPQQAGGMV